VIIGKLKELLTAQFETGPTSIKFSDLVEPADMDDSLRVDDAFRQLMAMIDDVTHRSDNHWERLSQVPVQLLRTTRTKFTYGASTHFKAHVYRTIMKDLAIAVGTKTFHELTSPAQLEIVEGIFKLESIENWRQLSIDYRTEQLEQQVKHTASPREKSPYGHASTAAGATPAASNKGTTSSLSAKPKTESGCIRHWLHKSNPAAYRKCPESTCHFKHDLPYAWRKSVADRDMAKYFQVPSREKDRAPLEAYVEKVFSTAIADKKLNGIRLANMGR